MGFLDIASTRPKAFRPGVGKVRPVGKDPAREVDF